MAEVDFGFPEYKLAVEYDGAWHGGRGMTLDRARMNRLLPAGWRVLFVTAADMRDPVTLAKRIAAELTA